MKLGFLGVTYFLFKYKSWREVRLGEALKILGLGASGIPGRKYQRRQKSGDEELVNGTVQGFTPLRCTSVLGPRRSTEHYDMVLSKF